MTDKVYPAVLATMVAQKLQDYIQLGKLRLSLTVVFSAGMAFLIAAERPMDWLSFAALLLGGLGITLAANSLNEVLEVRFDALMRRTAGRPLPAGRMARREALWFAIVAGGGGVALLALTTNILSGLLGLLSMLLYAFVYTPLKRSGVVAVFVGAVPGALPVVIGWAAATGSLDAGAWVLFAFQFFWQLPHFWAIAWVAHEDYQRAGFRLMPFGGQRDRVSAVQIAAWTMILIPVSFLPWYIGIAEPGTCQFLMLAGLAYFLQTIYLFIRLTRKAALWLMFGSFLYLPAVLIALLLDKLF